MSGTKKSGKLRDSSLLNIADDTSDNNIPELPSILQGNGYRKDTKEQPQERDGADGSAARKTFRVEPPSALLSRLQAFLPQIAEANKKLEDDMTEDPSKLDIENVEDSTSQYIEMDLGLGVFDMKSKKGSEKEDDIVINTRRNDDDSDSDNGDYEDSDSESGCHLQRREGHGLFGSKIIIDPSSISTSAKRSGKKPHIEILHSSKTSSNEDSCQMSEDSDQEMHE
ncbi:hypothetical protein EV175_000876 [Coemansia sp. RSA 1933]|nr:hypothetical protein EV175_000876 [Coemansia sp. RSA 1933]